MVRRYPPGTLNKVGARKFSCWLLISFWVGFPPPLDSIGRLNSSFLISHSELHQLIPKLCGSTLHNANSGCTRWFVYPNLDFLHAIYPFSNESKVWLCSWGQDGLLPLLETVCFPFLQWRLFRPLLLDSGICHFNLHHSLPCHLPPRARPLQCPLSLLPQV